MYCNAFNQFHNLGEYDCHFVFTGTRSIISKLNLVKCFVYVLPVSSYKHSNTVINILHNAFCYYFSTNPLLIGVFLLNKKKSIRFVVVPKGGSSCLKALLPTILSHWLCPRREVSNWKKKANKALFSLVFFFSSLYWNFQTPNTIRN